MKMYRYLVLLLGCIYCFDSKSQDKLNDIPDQTQLFSDFHGLVYSSGYYVFEGKGYSIILLPVKKQATAYNIDSVAKPYSDPYRYMWWLPGEKAFLKTVGIKERTTSNYRDSSLPLPNKVNRSVSYFKNEMTQEQRRYVLRTRTDEILDVFITKAKQWDSAFVRKLLLSIYYDGIPTNLVTPLQALKFDFIGREIALYPPGDWSEPHNLRVQGDQLNWSIHNSFEDAAAETNFQLQTTLLKRDAKVLRHDTIAVVFEGTPVQATRIVFKVPGVGYEARGQRELVAYYITAPVRGKFVHCVLSHYNYEVTDEALSKRVIPKIMFLQGDSSHTALYNKVKSGPLKQDYWNEGTGVQGIAGVWQPMGGLSNVIGTSPFLGGSLNIRLSKQYRLDIGANLIIPINRREFNYKLPDTVLLVKSSSVSPSIGIGVTHANRISKKWFFDQSIGFGITALQTDEKKPKNNNNDNDNYYNLTTTYFTAGFNVRKFLKKAYYIGLNVSYNYTPYHWFGDHVSKRFGSHSVSAGLIFGH